MSNPYNNNNYHLNHNNHQNRGNNNQITPSPQDAVNNLPYSFVPVGDEPVTRKPAVDLGKDDDSLYTGYINCSMYALNELCVGNSHQDLGNDKTAILPLTVNGKILIPSYTLKGCIANFMAAYLKLPITRMNNHRYSFRPNNSFGGTIDFGAGIVEKINDDGSMQVRKFKGKKYAYTQVRNQDGYYTYEDKNTKYAYLKPDPNGEYFKFFDYFDGIDGSGTMAKLFANASTEQKSAPSHKGFGVKLNSIDDNPLSDEIFQIGSDISGLYLETINMLMDAEIGHLCDHPLVERNDIAVISSNLKHHLQVEVNDLVIFEYAKGSDKIITFGKHFRYRWAFSRDLHNFTKDYQPYDLDSLKKGEVNTIEELFGYSYGDKKVTAKDAVPFENRSKSAKVHFSFAEHIAGTGELKKEKWVPRPGSPKPSSFEFYLRQNYKLFLNKEQLNGVLTTYGDPARKDYVNKPRLSGRKFYYKTAHTPNNDLKEETGVDKTVKLCDVLHPSKQGLPLFKFKVNYQNLSLSELHLLHFSLCLGQNIIPLTDKPLTLQNLFCHQIGYGKNYGMGAVKIVIDCTDDKEDVIRVNNDPATGKLNWDRLAIKPIYKLDEKCKDLMQLMLFGRESRSYPRFRGDIFQWHTKLKNDDLRARRDKGVQK